MGDIQWDLLGAPVDIPGAVQQGYQTGRALRTQREQDSALHALSANPDDSAAQNALMAVNPELAINYQRATLAREDSQRKGQARRASSDVIRAFAPSTTAPSAFAQPAAVVPSLPAPQQNAPGAALPQAPVNASLSAPAAPPAPIAGALAPSQPPSFESAPASVLDPAHPATQAVGAAVASQRMSPTDAVAELAKYADPEQVQQVLTTIKSMDAMQQAKLSEANDAMGVAAQSLLSVPDDPQHSARRQALMAQQEQLTQHGITPEQLATADLSDAALHGRIGQAIGVKAMIEAAQKDREAGHQDAVLAETARHDMAGERNALIKDVAPGGSVVDFGDGSAAAPGAAGGGSAASVPAIAARIAHVEGTARNPRSSAAGVGQFTDGTWLQCYRQFIGGQGMSDAQILAQKTDPKTASYLLQCFTQQNAEQLQAKGFTPSPTNVYLAHFLGLTGASSALSSDPSTPVARVLPAAVLNANPFLKNMTVANLQSWAAGKMDDTGGAATPAGTSHGGRVLFTAPEKPQTPPSGYRWKGDKLEAIPGGPADSAMLTPDDLRNMGEQYLAGDKSVFQNLGRGTQGAANIVKLRSEISRQMAERGMGGRDAAAQIAEFNGLVAGERTLGTRSANIEMASDEASRVIPLALQASQAIPRSSFLPFGRLEQAVEHGTNNEQYRKLYAATQAVVNVYARAISPTGNPTVNDKEHARHLLDSAYDQASYAAVLGQMQKEIGAARQAPADVRASFRDAVTGPQHAAADSGSIPTLTPEQARAAPSGTLFRTTDGRTMRKH